jgi:hypothetical protein
MQQYDRTPEKRTAADVAASLAERIGRELGVDDRGRLIVHYPARNQIWIERGDRVLERVDLGDRTRGEYRAWVEANVDVTDVDWNDGVFE